MYQNQGHISAVVEAHECLRDEEQTLYHALLLVHLQFVILRFRWEFDMASCQGQVLNHSVIFFFFIAALNVDNFHTDRYLYGFLTGLVEVPSYILPLPFLRCLGRRHTAIILFYVGGFALISILLIPKTEGQSCELQWVFTNVTRTVQFCRQ